MAKQDNLNNASIPQLTEKLIGLKRGGQFKSFIDSLRLYAFKNIGDAAGIDFTFPVTALVGPNGCGKSSVLQALYGCPKDSSLGNFWFSTSLDPISDEEGSRPSLVYTYVDTNATCCEVVKTRIQKQRGDSYDPDYWEPSRPLLKLGMTLLPGGKRHATIIMDVINIDFRYQLSAFDRYFYFEQLNSYHRNRRHRKQDVIRSRSSKILKGLDPNNSRSDSNEAVHILSQKEIATLSRILGKRYRAGKILFHKFHGFWAHTVVFEVESTLSPHKYTEANAGSGEVAVALLVHKLSNVKEGSLVLLDEPEYSLHPGAQREVLAYLLRQCIEKKLQIVFTTHAPAMIDGLPASSLKVFDIDPTTEKFVIHQNRSVDEAFVSIGQRVHSAWMIRVEDALAKELLEECMKKMVENNELPLVFPRLVRVVFEPGGVSAMKQDMVSYSRDDAKVFMVFDGTENT